MKIISSLWLILVLFFCCLIFCSAVIVASFIVKLLKDENSAHDIGHKIAIYWAKSILFLVPGWKASVEGIQHIPLNKKFVMVANHESHTDIFVVLLLGIQFRFIAKASLLKVPLVGQAMNGAGYISVDRGNRRSQMDALKESKRVIEEGRPMFFFAEGTRSLNGEMLPFKVGAFKIAKETEAMIVPICLKGTRTLLVKGSITPGKSNVMVKILPPIPSLPGEELDQWAARTREQIIIARENLAI